MEISAKIASALRGLMDGEKPKDAAFEKTLDLFGYPAEIGAELPEIEDPQEVGTVEDTAEPMNEDAKGEDTVSEDLKDPGQNAESITGKGSGKEY